MFTLDNYCNQGNVLGHNKTEMMEGEAFPLNPSGMEETIISLDFDPDWYVVHTTH